MNVQQKIFLALSATLLVVPNAQATLKSDKVTLNSNMTLSYTQAQKSVENIQDIFLEGTFNGRFRTNIFKWDWNEESSSRKDNHAIGVGGSILYKSARYKGLSFTSALYTSQNPSFYRMDSDDVGYLKAGKDTLSRYDTSQTDKFGMSVLGQAYLQYDLSESYLKAGRQIFESVFTKSNDTKMIPNTFDGLTATIKEIDKTKLTLAYLAKQKLRDHTSSHDVIAYNPTASGTQNDDSAVNRNLTTERVGSDNKLLIASVTTTKIENHKIILSYLSVPSILSQLVAEAYHTFHFNGIKIISGVRYLKQFDNLNANYDVANLKANSSGYTDPTSLDTSMVALKLDINSGAFSSRFGYSKIADKADIVSPWRSAPTGGFTRAMGQYNWYANTKTYMLQLGYDLSKAGLVDGLSLMARYAIQDFDDNKVGVQADTNILHIDARQNIGKNMELKLRLGFVSDEDKADKSDVSYNEYRMELNYFF